jgi:hypothetical protein
VSPVKYELGFYIPEEGVLHSDRRVNLKSYDDGFVPQMPVIRCAFAESASEPLHSGT